LPLDKVHFLIASPWGLPGPPPTGLEIVGEVYEITAANGVTDVLRPAVLGLHYDGVISSTVDGLGIYRWNFQTGSWDTWGGELDQEHRQVVTTTTELGLYALMGTSTGQRIYLPIIIK
jgi:hypothetical protein